MCNFMTGIYFLGLLHSMENIGRRLFRGGTNLEIVLLLLFL
jgi:hypothetical protein